VRCPEGQQKSASGAAVMRLLLLQNAENLFLTHNEEFLAIDFDFSS
jgi:hypothetical protein